MRTFSCILRNDMNSHRCNYIDLDVGWSTALEDTICNPWTDDNFAKAQQPWKLNMETEPGLDDGFIGPSGRQRCRSNGDSCAHYAPDLKEKSLLEFSSDEWFDASMEGIMESNPGHSLSPGMIEEASSHVPSEAVIGQPMMTATLLNEVDA
ncbi:hypothetical protein K505DRAFT_337860 [Melanomma pulvis-pyrius CBS 109.77]|uniref:Uncharacterized protein n=1 Tax=Melanomma pulvis-pyrius CBS 109.77 TaxID=1314802 RepID=A0A6A6XAV4_9PLEO|nr:hypothetical protein K505DRAFT_337860 [Melanomma pulvis-pyrius CBS 109.77]